MIREGLSLEYETRAWKERLYIKSIEGECWEQGGSPTWGYVCTYFGEILFLPTSDNGRANESGSVWNAGSWV